MSGISPLRIIFAGIIAMAAWLPVGCGRTGVPSVLVEIDSICSVDPALALAMLDSIDPVTLPSDADRDVYDLLRIKAPDKAYIMHTSDSLVLSVIDRISRRDPYGRLPEALYYGGRVYSDLGDYPTSLRYFQDAIDAFPDNQADSRLRCSVMSQTGRLLHLIQMNSQAIPYLEEAIRISRANNNSQLLMYDLDLLGSILFQEGKYADARALMYQSNAIAESISSDYKWICKLSIATTFFHENKIDSALFYIDGIKANVDSLARTTILSLEARTYLKAGMLDSAYNSAMQLLACKDKTNFRQAYSVLLSPEMSAYIPQDSIRKLAYDFYYASAAFLGKMDSRQTVQQESMYNYRLHEREKQKAVERKNKYAIGVKVCIGILIILLALYIYNIYKRKMLQLQLLNVLNQYNKVLDGPEEPSKEKVNFLPPPPSPDELRKQLRRKILDKFNSLEESEQKNITSPEQQQFLSDSEMWHFYEVSAPPKFSHPVWKNMENDIKTLSPHFFNTIKILSPERLNDDEIRILVLIRFGFTPTQIGLLVARTKGTISARRASLSKKIFGEPLGPTNFDRLIRMI